MSGRLGRSGTAPCGHPGEAVVGTYYRCLSGCDSPLGAVAVSDGVPEPLEDDPETEPLCRRCGADALITYPNLGTSGATWLTCTVCFATWSIP